MNIKKINTVQNKACRYILGLGKNATNVASQGDMGWTSCITKLKTEAYRLFLKKKASSDNKIVNSVFNWSILPGKSWEIRCKTLLHDIGLNELISQEGRSIKNKINCVKQKLLQMDQTT